MRDTILLVGHGSRQREGNLEIIRFAEAWRARRPDLHIEVCFIEFDEVLLSDGLARAAKTSRRVIVVPLILNAAGHVKMEIPEHIEHARAQFPQVRFIYTPHLGANDAILAILKRRLMGALADLDMPDPATTGIIVLGRGSSDRQANGEVAKIARWLHEDTRHELVDIAFTGITWPRLERVAQRQARLGMMQIAIIPYYLFTGTLIQRIERQVAHLRAQYPQLRFALTDYFGFEPEIFELLDRHVHNALHDRHEHAMPCDGCRFREIAAALGHGHHHDDRAHDHSHRHSHEHAHEPIIATV